jgi:hypothetical protein
MSLHRSSGGANHLTADVILVEGTQLRYDIPGALKSYHNTSPRAVLIVEGNVAL